jgi:hypothetical protein
MTGEVWQQDFGVFPAGKYTAWSSADGMRSEIRDQSDERVVERLRGESSWSDAVRKAGDLNSELRK